MARGGIGQHMLGEAPGKKPQHDEDAPVHAQWEPRNPPEPDIVIHVTCPLVDLCSAGLSGLVAVASDARGTRPTGLRWWSRPWSCGARWCGARSWTSWSRSSRSAWLLPSGASADLYLGKVRGAGTGWTAPTVPVRPPVRCADGALRSRNALGAECSMPRAGPVTGQVSSHPHDTVRSARGWRERREAAR